MFEKTLIPVAYGERPEELEKVGKVLKSLGTTTISLFHVNEPGSLFRRTNPSWLTHLAEALEGVGLTVEINRGDGHIASTIAEAAITEGADGIYMKAKRRWHIETMLLGSVSRDLLRLADLPIFVQKVRPRLSSSEEESFHSNLRVLYATDLDETSARFLLPHIKGLQGAWCHVLHVRRRMADPTSELIQQDSVNRDLCTVAEELRSHFGRVTTEAKIGNPASQVLHVSEQIEADIITLGRRKPAFFSVPMGKTAERIVIGSKASIFLVPQPRGRNAS